MRYFYTSLLTLCLAVSATARPLQQNQTAEGYRYAWIGALPQKPTATVLFLGGEIEYNITAPQYAKAVEAMCAKVFCLTVDGPGEGADITVPKIRSLRFWAQHLTANEDFIGNFVSRTNIVLGKLIRDGVIDPGHIGVFGTSRGAFIGFHLAASDPKIRAVAAFSPVTDLTVLTEFRETEKSKAAATRMTVASREKFTAKLSDFPFG